MHFEAHLALFFLHTREGLITNDVGWLINNANYSSLRFGLLTTMFSRIRDEFRILGPQIKL